MNKYRSIILSVILFSMIGTSVFIYRIESEKRGLQDELIELSSVKYGLFNVDEWKEIITDIIIQRLDDFDLDDSNRAQMRERLNTFLQDVVADLEESFYDKNTGSITGLFKRGTAKVTGVFDVMREDIPLIIDNILNFMEDRENRKKMRDYLIKKMDEYSEETFSETDYSLYDEILQKHNADSKEDALQTIKQKIDRLRTNRMPFEYTLFALVIFLFLYTAFSKDIDKNDFALLTALCGVLLLIGLLLPMINIDARISKMNFHLLGEQVSFTDQVLYFKSKSILEVVALMFKNSNIDVLLVGILVLMFSVIFPVSKLSFSILYLYFESMRKNGFVNFLVFKTAKWSMADVMVVAIFMAYIGFSGIVSEQLRELESIVESVDMVTTNASSLQIGFYLFASFVLLSVLVSYKLQYSHLKKLSDN